VVNDRMKAVGGYANGNLVIWDKIKEAFPGIQIRRVWSYDNADVAANVPVAVEVPGAPIGGTGKHWVVYIGNKKLNDPWGGTVRPTSDFAGPSGYCVVTGKWAEVSEGGDMYKGYDLTNKESMKVAVDILVRVQAGEFVDKGELEKAKQTVDNLNQQINDRNNDIVQLNARISTLDQQLSELTTRAASFEEQAKRVPNLEHLVNEYELKKSQWSEREKTYNRTVGQLRAENESLKKNSLSALIQNILDKLGLK